MEHRRLRGWGRLLIGLLVVTFLTACGRAQPAAEPVVEEPRLDVQALDAFFQEAQQRHAIPGLAVAIVSARGPLYVRGFGVDGEGNPITPRTPFRIASLSKSFTALAVLQLVDAGRIELDAPVQRYLPDFTVADRSRAAQITVRHLLQQVSGLNDAGYAQPLQSTDLAALTADLARARPFAQPGTQFAYFNPNYEVLGRLVEVVSGQPFDLYLQERVLAPLGLWSTRGDSAAVPPVPRGHLMPFRFAVPTDEPLDPPLPSGGLISTADDMGRYLSMHLNNGSLGDTRLLSAEGIAHLHTPRQGREGYAMGWFVRDGNAVPRVVEHGGALATYAAQMALLPDQGLAVALLYNENHLLSALWLQPALLDAVVSLLDTENLPEQLPPARWIGIGLLGVVAVSLAGSVAAIVRVPDWRQRVANRTRHGRLLAALNPLLVLVWLPLIPWLAGLAMGRTVTPAMIYSYTPDLVLWLFAGVAFNMVLAARRLVALTR